MSSLESKLHSLALQGGGKAAGGAAHHSSSNGVSNPEFDVSPIKCVGDEVDYWQAVQTTGGAAGERAAMFLERMTGGDFELAKSWDEHALRALKPDDLAQLLDDTQYNLSELWLAVRAKSTLQLCSVSELQHSMRLTFSLFG